MKQSIPSVGRRRRQRNAPMVNIGSTFDKPAVKFMVEAVAKALNHAIETGRTEIGVELAKQLGQLGGVHDVTITNCVLNG